MSKTLWLLVTSDKYELPLVVEDSAGRLARRLGTKANNIISAISKSRNRKGRCKFVKVVIEDNDDL